MSTVRMTTSVTQDIIGIARGKMQPAVDIAANSKPDASWGQFIYDTLWGNEIDIAKQLPSYWFTVVDKIRIQEVAGCRCYMTFQLKNPQPWPVYFPNNHPLASSPHSDGDFLTLNHDFVWSELHAVMVAYQNRLNEARQRQTEFTTMVSTLLGTYNTLAPALKAWPPLWELLPADIQRKHEEVTVSRGKREAAVPASVDLNRLTAISTALKFGL